MNNSLNVLAVTLVVLICSLFLNGVSAAEAKEVLRARLDARKNTLKVNSAADAGAGKTVAAVVVADAESSLLTEEEELAELKSGLRARLNARRSSLKADSDSSENLVPQVQLSSQAELKAETKKLFKSKAKVITTSAVNDAAQDKSETKVQTKPEEQKKVAEKKLFKSKADTKKADLLTEVETSNQVKAEIKESKVHTDKVVTNLIKTETKIAAPVEEKKNEIEANTVLLETESEAEAESEVGAEELTPEMDDEVEEDEQAKQEVKILAFPSFLEESSDVTPAVAVQISSQTEVKRTNGRLRSEALTKKQKVVSEVDMQAEEEQTAADAKVKGCVPNVPRTCPNGQSLRDLKITANTDGCGLSLPKHEALVMSNSLKNKFAPCCNVHNICYSTVGSDKDDCDYLFYSCMLDQCEETFCKSRAFWFYRTVSKLGCPTFENVQKLNGCGVNF